MVESSPQRVRRTRPVLAVEEVEETTNKARVRRVRSAPVVEEVTTPRRGRFRGSGAGSSSGDSRPYFLIDWDRPLSWKFSIYMVTSYLYYCLNRSIITDHDYDRLCHELGDGYDDFEHQHKHLVDRGQFEAGTGYDIKYPQMVIGAAGSALDNYREI